MTDQSLYNLSLEELTAWVKEQGEKPFRARQIYQQLYRRRNPDPRAMTDLPPALQDKLLAAFPLNSIELKDVLEADKGYTRKALFQLNDGSPLESVLMVYPDRATVCVSSQSGCPMQCVFCATGKLGFLHDLTPGQIIEQVMWACHELDGLKTQPGYRGPDHLTNVVYMGMGEPFNNYDQWWTSVERLHDPDGFNLGARSFTVSTVGLVPGIQRLADEALPVNLAVSLHAADDEKRSHLMPVNRRYPIDELLKAVREYIAQTRRRVSFEYVLLHDENDDTDTAARLAERLLQGHPADEALLFHVNLIPWNPVPGSPLTRSHRQRVHDFQATLHRHRIPCTVRVERGTEIMAACGQLAGAASAPEEA